VKPLFNYDFSKPVILDTNTLLNATFISGGLAEHALWSLRKMGTPLYVTPGIEGEVAKLAERLKREYKLNYDPAEAVRIALGAHGILTAPLGGGTPLAGINRADEPIARSAKQLGAAIVTDDIEFIIEARAAGVEAWQYWEVARSFRGAGELRDLGRIVRYGVPQPHGSYIFARIAPGGWAGLKIDQKFSVCEVEDGLWVYYDGAGEQWHVRTPSGEIVRLSMPLLNDRHYVVGVHTTRSGRFTQVTLMAAEAGGPPAMTREVVARPGAPTSMSRLNVGHNRRRSDHWNGVIKDLVVASGALPPRTFRLLASTEDLSPNPADSDKLGDAVQRVIMLAS
jgi:hypothetical protein